MCMRSDLVVDRETGGYRHSRGREGSCLYPRYRIFDSAVPGVAVSGENPAGIYSAPPVQ